MFCFFFIIVTGSNEPKPLCREEKANPDMKSLAAPGGGLQRSVAAALQSSALNATLTPQVRISPLSYSPASSPFLLIALSLNGLPGSGNAGDNVKDLCLKDTSRFPSRRHRCYIKDDASLPSV